MKHVFIVNPHAGKGKAAPKFVPQIHAYFKAHPELSYEIYETREKRDGLTYTQQLAKTGEPIRFYACGGDGTLFEVINGAYQYENTQVACIPLGSGNDFARILGDRKALCDVAAQVEGTPRQFDLIRRDNQVAISQCSMGLDAEVCAKQATFKKLPGVSGEMAYTLSSVHCLFHRLNSDFKILVDDKEVYNGPILFALCGNSRWYGGGYKGAPLARPDDGLLDFILMKRTVGRLKLLSLLPTYKKGEHLDNPLTIFMRGKKMQVLSRDPRAVNVDGECQYVTESTFEILEKAVNFVIPTTSTYDEIVNAT